MINSISNNSSYHDIIPVGRHLTKAEEAQFSQAELKNLKKTGKIECETCKNRKYMDGSDDEGVSYQTPTNIDPTQSAAKVMAHEQEHVTRNAAKAEREGRKVVSSLVTTQRSICPECGRSYTSGGLTKTVTRKDKEKEDDKNHFSENFFNNTVGKNQAKKFDYQI